MGGGIRNRGTLTVSGSTLGSNSAALGGGIADVQGGAVTLQQRPSWPTASRAATLYLDTGNGSTYSGSYDLIGDGSESSSFTNSLFVNPLLAALGYYGGPTQTLALLPGSPAIRNGLTVAGHHRPARPRRPVNSPRDTALSSPVQSGRQYHCRQRQRR